MLPNELDKHEEIIFFKGKKNVYCMSTFNSNGHESYLHVMYIIYFCTILFQVLLVCDHSKRFYINSNTIALQKVTYLRAKSFRFIKIYIHIYMRRRRHCCGFSHRDFGRLQNEPILPKIMQKTGSL